jgi:hypothetical protein
VNAVATRARPADVPGLATVLGFQEDGEGGGFWLFNLTRDIAGHPAGSTVAEKTVRAHLELERRIRQEFALIRNANPRDVGRRPVLAK